MLNLERKWKEKKKQSAKKIKVFSQCAAHACGAGEDLLQASADKPFRFPATFTFVVRSFTVLDGIGKSLSPRFDMTEIAAPYARGLVLEAKPQIEKLAQEFQKRLQQQVSQPL